MTNRALTSNHEYLLFTSVYLLVYQVMNTVMITHYETAYWIGLRQVAVCSWSNFSMVLLLMIMLTALTMMMIMVVVVMMIMTTIIMNKIRRRRVTVATTGLTEPLSAFSIGRRGNQTRRMVMKPSYILGGGAIDG